MDTARLDRLRKYRSLSNSDICDMPIKLLQRAIAKADSPNADHPDEWASFRAMRQADENGIVKPDGLIKGIQQRQAIVAAQLAAQMAAELAEPLLAGISPSGWTAIGPGNIGGRIRSILIHPTQTNKMWAGSVGGGIWVSTDSGASWSPVNDFMGNLSVSSLVMDPTDSNILYAGTGEGFFNPDTVNDVNIHKSIDGKVRGAGIFKSTDGGVTWSQMPSTNPLDRGSQWYYVNRLAVHPGNGQIMLAATGSGTYRTTNGGDSWSPVASGRALDVRFNPNDGNNAIIARNNGLVLYSTTAASATSTWTPVAFLNGGKRVELAYARSAANTAYAAVDVSAGVADLYKTTNGGATWSYVSSPNHLGNQGWYDNAIWVDPTNSNHLIVGGLDLWQSTNGGVSFTQISLWSNQPKSPHADHHAIVSSPAYNGSTNRTIFFGNDGGVYKAQDIAAVTGTLPFQAGWSAMNNGLNVTQFYGGVGKAADGAGRAGRIIGGTQDNGDLKYDGTGTKWSAFYGGDGGYSAADSLNDNYLYGEYIRLAIHRSIDGGASPATSICKGITEGKVDVDGEPPYCGATATSEANFIAPFILDPNNNDRMLAGAKSLWVSDNVKAATPSWRIFKPAVTPACSPYPSRCYISAISVAEGNSNIIWVGHNNGQVYKTINGTAASPTWTLVSGLPAGRMALRILVDKSDPTNRVYVSFGGFSAGNLQLTTNGGTTWTSISGTLPNVPIGSIVRHPTNPNWLYAGTEVGLFTSENGGSSWTATNDGPANVSVDELFWYDNTTLVAATHGRGMFKATLAPSCSYSIGSASQSVGAGVTVGNVKVMTTVSGCAWTAVSNNAGWITVTSGASGSGNGSVGYSIAANTGANWRTGTVTIAEKTFTVTQDGTQSGTLPSAPNIGTATPGNGSVRVAFTPGAIGSGTLLNYTANCGGITGTGTSPIMVSGLTNGIAYRCWVRTTSTAGIGPWSAASNSVTPLATLTLPSAPTIGTATPGNGSARVAFTPGAIGSGTPLYYQAICGGITGTGTGSPIMVLGLTNGTAYTCRVRTTSTVGIGPWSAVSNAVTPLASLLLPAAPTIGIATAGNGSARVAFTPGAIGSGTLLYYQAICGAVTGTGTSPIMVSGLTNGTAYTCRVRTTSTAGIGLWSAASNSVTPLATLTLPSAPTIGTATPGNGSARVAFTPGAIGSGTLLYYQAICGGIVGTGTGTGSASPIVVSGLRNGTAYRCWVRTTSTVGIGPWSAASNIVVPSGLNDTGITASQCYQAGSDTLVACSSAGAIALSNAQDGMTGRDANPATNSNTNGKLGFSFAGVTGGCVYDNVTGLMWEVKTTDGGLRDWNKTYTNYSPTYNPYGQYGTATDASGFVTTVNASNLCGYSGWRLPTADELQSIVDYGVAYPGPTIDATWFPNTQGSAFWSASPYVGSSYGAWVVDFYVGGVGYYGRNDSNYVRLVRAGQ